jgi:hypothetical protein
MAKRKPAQEDDFGFVPSEDIPFTPEEQMAAGKKMGAAAIPTMKSKEEDFGFVPYAPEFLDQEGTPVTLEEIGQTAKDVITTAPQGVTTWADEIQAMAQAGGKKILGAEEPLMDIYGQDVSQLRQDIGAARERSPWATTIGEAGVGIGSALLPGALAAKGIGGLGALAANTAAAGRFSGIGGMALRGGVEGMGAAESMDPYEMGTYGLGGAALGTAGALATKGIKAITTQSPERIRAGVLGAKTSQFQEIGSKEREALAKELHDMGLFQKTKAEFDTSKGKWIPKGSALENIELPTRDKLLNRVKDAFESTQEQKKKIFAREFAKPVINPEGIAKNLDNIAEEWANRRSGIEPRLEIANKEIKQIFDDLNYKVRKSKDKILTIEMLEEAKQRLDEDVRKIGKDPLLNKVEDMSDLYIDIYKTINESLQFEIPDPAYAKLNSIQSKLYTAKTDLKKAIASESPKFSPTNLDTWFQSPESQLDIARAAEVMNMPGLKQIKTPLRTATSELPYAALRFIDPSIPMPSDQGPYRAPQSIGFSPKDIINFKIPRNTQAIMENKDMVLAKLVQQGADPAMVDAITEGLNGTGKEVSKAIPFIINQMPLLFEDSKYNVFDGKFLDPNDRAKAADDISRRDDLNSIERARMINKINKSGEVPEGL